MSGVQLLVRLEHLPSDVFREDSASFCGLLSKNPWCLLTSVVELLAMAVENEAYQWGI